MSNNFFLLMPVAGFLGDNFIVTKFLKTELITDKNAKYTNIKLTFW